MMFRDYFDKNQQKDLTMSLFAPKKMSLNASKNWASKFRRLKDSCLANTLVPVPFIPNTGTCDKLFLVLP